MVEYDIRVSEPTIHSRITHSAGYLRKWRVRARAPREAAPARRATAATYALVQQLLPGVEQDPTRLEMGRKYEEVDSGAVDRERGAAATDREKAVAAGAAEGMKS